MVQRAWVVGIVTFWVLSMGWLTATKIAPLFRRGDQPIQQVFRPDEEPSPVAMRWRVEYRERVVGWAETTVVRHDDLTGAVQSVVTFRELPLKDVASDLFGALSMLLQAAGELENLQASLVVNTQMRFDAEGQLTRFNTHVHVADMTNLLELNGHVRDNILQLVAFLNTPRTLREDGESSGRRELVRREVTLPEGALVADAMSPTPQLANLRVGQVWTFQSYRPFPPNRPLQLVEARVESTETYPWEGKEQQVYVVVFRDEAGTGITSAREPTSRLWVTRDGQVVRQELMISRLRVIFVREPYTIEDEASEEEASVER